jgi:uncharacterized protein (DUF305 family)
MIGMTSTLARGIAAALLAAVVAGCGGARSAVPGSAPVPSAGTAVAGQPHAQGLEAGIAKARADSVRLPWTAADARFMTMMIGHHSQAIVMARMAPTHGASGTVRTLAERIINAQEDEIATMQQWLRERRQPVPEPGAAMSAHTAAGGEHAGHTMPGAMPGMSTTMPGMLSAEQLQKLDQARGKEFDRLFLTSMIQHHKGATSMVQELFGTDGAAQDEIVFKFASDVNVDQTTEIARMERMLIAIVLEGGAP